MEEETSEHLIGALKDFSLYKREQILKERWYGFCSAHKLPTDWATGVYYLMQKFYRLPAGLRHYHTLEGHIFDCLKALDRFRKSVPDYTDKWFSVEYAIWMHDIFYLAGIGMNESRSALLADTLLYPVYEKYDQGLTASIIVDTELGLPHLNITTTPESMLVCDIDLVGMGGSYEQFVLNGDLVRQEFAQFTDEEYAVGRKKFFEDFYSRGYVYRLPYFKTLYEKQTRENIMLYISNGRFVPKK